MTLVTPQDGRITSQNVLAGPLTGGEVQEIVSPGNAAQGNTYQVTTAVLAAFYSAFSALNSVTLTTGATLASPYAVLTTATCVLFNKTVGSASYAQLPLAATMLYGQPVLFKDLKGDTVANPITISFTGGELCDGQATIVINTAYGHVALTPVPGGGAWYQS